MTNKKHKFIKLISIILCVCLIGGAFAGCGAISMLYHLGTEVAEGDADEDDTILDKPTGASKHSKEDVEKYLESKYPTWKFEECDFSDESVYCGENNTNGYSKINSCSSHWRALTMPNDYLFSVVCENGQLKDNLPQVYTNYTIETEMFDYISDELKINSVCKLVLDDVDYSQTKMPLDIEGALAAKGSFKCDLYVYNKSKNLKEAITDLGKWLKGNNATGNVAVYVCDYGPTEMDKANSNLDINNSKEYAVIHLNEQGYNIDFK